eukprot:scaffold3423_cov379-Prasinococcus_capsulatus_cf.AAC.1
MTRSLGCQHSRRMLLGSSRYGSSIASISALASSGGIALPCSSARACKNNTDLVTTSTARRSTTACGDEHWPRQGALRATRRARAPWETHGMRGRCLA